VNSTVDLLSGGQRQSVCRCPVDLLVTLQSWSWMSRWPPWGVREGANVLGLIQNLRRQRKRIDHFDRAQL